MLDFSAASNSQLSIATQLCKALTGWLPQQPSTVQVADSGRHRLFLIRFAQPGVMLLARFFHSKERAEPQIVELRIVLQPMQSSFRLLTHCVSYEELGELFAGTPIHALQGTVLREFICDEDIEEEVAAIEEYLKSDYRDLLPLAAA